MGTTRKERYQMKHVYMGTTEAQREEMTKMNYEELRAAKKKAYETGKFGYGSWVDREIRRRDAAKSRNDR